MNECKVCGSKNPRTLVVKKGKCFDCIISENRKGTEIRAR